MERDVDIADLVILVQTLHSRVQFIDMPGRCLRNSAGVLGPVAGLGGRLVGCIGSRLSLMNACLCPGIHVLDLLGVLCVYFIEFGQAIVNRIKPFLDPLFPSHGVNPTPKPFSLISVRRRRRWGGWLYRGRRSTLRLTGGLRLLSHRRNRNCGREQKRRELAGEQRPYHSRVFHISLGLFFVGNRRNLRRETFAVSSLQVQCPCQSERTSIHSAISLIELILDLRTQDGHAAKSVHSEKAGRVVFTGLSSFYQVKSGGGASSYSAST